MTSINQTWKFHPKTYKQGHTPTVVQLMDPLPWVFWCVLIFRNDSVFVKRPSRVKLTVGQHRVGKLKLVRVNDTATRWQTVGEK